jgi:type IV pilus assembly protein PilA
MLTAIKQRLERDEEQGFTLIELMVVVLIIAILLAIAIPTFLGARNTANARGAQSNLRNALTAEQTAWTNNQQFSADVSTTGMPAIESGINWTTGTAGTTTPNQVSVAVSTDNNAVQLQAQGKDGNCYYILQSNEASNSYTGYYESKGTCATNTIPTTLPSSVTSGAASTAANMGTSGAAPTSAVYSTF